MGHGKPRKSWNFYYIFQAWKVLLAIEMWVMESHGKAINVLRMNRQKKSKVVKNNRQFSKHIRYRSLFMSGGGGGRNHGGPGPFLSKTRGGPKENFTRIEGGSLCDCEE